MPDDNLLDHPVVRDLTQLKHDRRFTLSLGMEHPESKEQEQARIKRENKEADAALKRAQISFYMSIFGIIFLVILAFYTCFMAQSPDPDMKKWAVGIIQSCVALLSGKIGFDLRGKTK